MKISYFLLYVGVALILVGCAAFGSKTLYKSEEVFQKEPARVGYCQVAGEDKLNQLFDSTGSFYRQAIEADLTKRQIEPVFVEVKDYSDFHEINPADIAEICETNALDGFVIGKLRFVFISYSVTIIPLGQSQDTEVEMQYFSNNGKLLIHTSHNTYNGNSYPEMPIATKTVRDGATGAIKKIFKEMKK